VESVAHERHEERDLEISKTNLRAIRAGEMRIWLIIDPKLFTLARHQVIPIPARTGIVPLRLRTVRRR
jgi:hypothetical protein